MKFIKSTISLKRLKRYYQMHSFYLLLSIIIAIVPLIISICLNYQKHIVITPTKLSFLEIFSHNLLIGILIILAGLLTLGIGSSIFIIINFYTLGKTIITVINSYGIKPIITAILPHAFFELSATLFCCCLGFETLRIVKNIKSSAKGEKTKPIYIGDAIMQFIFIIVLYAIAAFIESTVAFA